MQHLYRRYAYCDSIEIENIKILQSCRDWEFEGWLKIIGIDVNPHLKISKTSALVGKGTCSSLPFGSFFRFERHFSVVQNNKRIVVNHSTDSCLYSEITGTFRKSSSSDILTWTEFKSNEIFPTETHNKKHVNSRPGEKPSGRHKVSLGKMTPPHTAPIVTDFPQSKTMRGVEVDESF